LRGANVEVGDKDGLVTIDRHVESVVTLQPG
jgi:hypothetical protein